MKDEGGRRKDEETHSSFILPPSSFDSGSTWNAGGGGMGHLTGVSPPLPIPPPHGFWCFAAVHLHEFAPAASPLRNENASPARNVSGR